jgi:hypothetical protein
VKGAPFYEAIAQLLPLLAILLLIEAEIMRLADGWLRTVMFGVFALAGLAELRALYALWAEQRWGADFVLLISPLAFLIGVMFAIAVNTTVNRS